MNDSELKQALDELKTDRRKFDYVMARSSFDSVEAALKEAGASKGWFYTQPKEEQARLEMLASELHFQAKMKAAQIIEDAVVEAAEVKISGLKSRNENIKQNAATEIIDRALGKPTQRSELTGANGGPIQTQSWSEFIKSQDVE